MAETKLVRWDEPLTPMHTIDVLEKSVASAPVGPNTGTAFVRVDTRVLLWLLHDVRTLHARPEILEGLRALNSFNGFPAMPPAVMEAASVALKKAEGRAP
ncbi:hypothetical protein [Xanthobacter aminoxidans]|uniref:hypothetical protein n=1 Tax=Xanthobacter aminoxidans TaxID=186280 RepID=UPI002022FA2F|nr:hypothetical protein [Xanthobacter aminoxidans]MCL8382110.1 hypothetical protein [Xanthobacter aminoxidans]